MYTNQSIAYRLLFPLFLRIYIEISIDVIVPIQANTYDTIADIKLKIQDKKAIPMNLQQLHYRSKCLKDEHTILEYNIQEGATIQLLTHHDTMQIFVKTWNNRMIPLEVEASDLIEDIKEKICHKEKIPSKQQLLKYRTSQLKDKCTVQDYGIQDGAQLDLHLHLEIYAKTPDGDLFMLEVEPSETIESIKHKIQDERGISPNQ